MTNNEEHLRASTTISSYDPVELDKRIVRLEERVGLFTYFFYSIIIAIIAGVIAAVTIKFV